MVNFFHRLELFLKKISRSKFPKIIKRCIIEKPIRFDFFWFASVRMPFTEMVQPRRWYFFLSGLIFHYFWILFSKLIFYSFRDKFEELQRIHWNSFHQNKFGDHKFEELYRVFLLLRFFKIKSSVVENIIKVCVTNATSPILVTLEIKRIKELLHLTNPIHMVEIKLKNSVLVNCPVIICIFWFLTLVRQYVACTDTNNILEQNS